MEKKKKKVLSDHRRFKKKLIPPFIDKLGSLQETSWVKEILPELLWIALIQDQLGERQGVSLITEIGRAANHAHLDEQKHFHGTISSFSMFNDEEKKSFLLDLKQSSHLSIIIDILAPILVPYESCPLGYLKEYAKVINGDVSVLLDRLKPVVGKLYHKRERFAVMTQATYMWLAFDAGVLFVKEGLVLADFPEIEKYPSTELSRKLAASISASIMALFRGPHNPEQSDWSTYF